MNNNEIYDTAYNNGYVAGMRDGRNNLLNEQSINHKCCIYCGYDSEHNEYFQDFVGDWYHNVKTDQYDDVDKDYIYIQEYGVNFCQYCGKPLQHST